MVEEVSVPAGAQAFATDGLDLNCGPGRQFVGMGDTRICVGGAGRPKRALSLWNLNLGAPFRLSWGMNCRFDVKPTCATPPSCRRRSDAIRPTPPRPKATQSRPASHNS